MAAEPNPTAKTIAVKNFFMLRLFFVFAGFEDTESLCGSKGFGFF
jgi:hypothetical protein